MRTVTGIARPRVLGFRSWLPAALTSCPHTVSKAVHSPPRTVTAWCPLQLISHWSHLETQREVGSASTSSALLTGALQAFKLPGLVPLLQSQLTNRSLCPNGALVPLLIATSPHPWVDKFPATGLLPQFPHTDLLVTIRTELLGWAGASYSVPLTGGPRAQHPIPAALLSCSPLGSHPLQPHLKSPGLGLYYPLAGTRLQPLCSSSWNTLGLDLPPRGVPAHKALRGLSLSSPCLTSSLAPSEHSWFKDQEHWNQTVHSKSPRPASLCIHDTDEAQRGEGICRK